MYCCHNKLGTHLLDLSRGLNKNNLICVLYDDMMDEFLSIRHFDEELSVDDLFGEFLNQLKY